MDFERAVIDRIIEKCGRTRSATIPILQGIQRECRYIPPGALEYVGERIGVPAAQVYGVATFYSQFRLEPVGTHLIKVCHGTACHVADAQTVSEVVAETLGVSPDGGTTDDRMFTLESVACLGCCSLAPVMMIDDRVYGKLTRQKINRVLARYRKEKEAGAAEVASLELKPKELGEKAISTVLVGLGSCGIAAGAQSVYDFFQRVNETSALQFDLKKTGCCGLCHREPLVELIDADGARTLYGSVDVAAAERILKEHICEGKVVDDFLIDVESPGREEHAFFAKQRHIVLENCGRIDPESVSEYVAVGGYKALEKVLQTMKPEDVITVVAKSGLRGRGGAGFSTGLKWKLARQAHGAEKYVVCNADEGDPGAFMDRSVLESDPHRVLEGMTVAAYAIGAAQGYIYCRAEYPLAVKRLKTAIAAAQDNGYLGKNILGSDFSFDVAVKEGAGAFVCGEETALIASVEGGRGMPRVRPPFPTQSGLWEKPTNINNVETFANVPWIIRNGWEAYASMGTERSKGTKVFALAGDVKRGGLVEVPMGITLREVIDEVGGGTASGKAVKAVQLGGPSGGCIPAHLMDTMVDYEAVTKTGAIMGSGGMVVMDISACMVDIAKFFLQFTQNESCGKCTFCRIGTKRMLEILTRITEGEGKEGDIDLLLDLSEQIKASSLCGLGQTAPNPVLTTLRYFREEYEAHIKHSKCHAAKCRKLITYTISAKKCTGCGACLKVCPVNAIVGERKKVHTILQEVCTSCGACKQICPFDAVDVE